RKPLAHVATRGCGDRCAGVRFPQGRWSPTERAIVFTVKRAERAAGIEAPISPHWLRRAHASHAIDRGATLPEVQSTRDHGNIAATSGYLHARSESSSGLRWDPGVWLR